MSSDGPTIGQEIIEGLRELMGDVKAGRFRMSPGDAEEQRRSFAHGNVAISNPNVTREIVDREAEAMGDNGMVCYAE